MNIERVETFASGLRESVRARFERRCRSGERERCGDVLRSFAEELEDDLWDRDGRNRSIG